MDTAKKMLSGSKYIQAKKMAHCDVKPANILVLNRHYKSTETEEVQTNRIICKLTDFA